MVETALLLSGSSLIKNPGPTTTKWEAQRRYLQGGYQRGDHGHGNTRVDHHKLWSPTTACARATFTAYTSSSHESNLLILEGTIWWRSRGEGTNPVLVIKRYTVRTGLQGRILRFRWRIDGFNPAN